MKFSDPRAMEAIKDARKARERAYAPYSGFKMGAVVVTDTNAFVPGTLIENVSLGLAMCAERTALFGSVASDSGTPQILALVSPRTGGELTWPCGACLQVALELGGPELLVVVADADGSAEPCEARLHELAGRLPFKGAR